MALTFLGRTGKPEQSPEPPRHPYMPQTNGAAAVGTRRMAAEPPADRPDDLQAALARMIEQSSDTPAQQGAAAPASLPAPASPPAGRRSHPPAPAPESAGEDRLMDDVQAALARLEAQWERPPSDGLLNQIDALATNIERQNGELRTLRATVMRVQADNTRLATENERLRRMLKSLLAALDADGKRVSDSLDRAERRLRDLVPTMAEAPPAQPMRPAQRPKPDAARPEAAE